MINNQEFKETYLEFIFGKVMYNISFSESNLPLEKTKIEWFLRLRSASIHLNLPGNITCVESNIIGE